METRESRLVSSFPKFSSNLFPVSWRKETRNAISFPIWFPFVSRFAPYARETRNERRVSRDRNSRNRNPGGKELTNVPLNPHQTNIVLDPQFTELGNSIRGIMTFEARGVEPFYTGPNAKTFSTDYAVERSKSAFSTLPVPTEKPTADSGG
jgi:hypothetical protein